MAARARIFQSRKSSMQSGHNNTGDWVLEWERTERKQADPIMGWWGSGDTRTQLRLRFDSREEAEAYAKREALAVEVEIVPPRIQKPKSYADNFKYTRLMNWTH